MDLGLTGLVYKVLKETLSPKRYTRKRPTPVLGLLLQP